MHGTRSLIDMRSHQTNKGQTDFNYRTQQPHIERKTDQSKVNNNDNHKNQNARFFRIEGQLRYH